MKTNSLKLLLVLLFGLVFVIDVEVFIKLRNSNKICSKPHYYNYSWALMLAEAIYF